MTLVALAAAYRGARRRTDRAAKFTPLECPVKTCRYCGKWWILWNGSKLDGHAACIVDNCFKHALKVVLKNPRLTYRDVALALEVSPSVVRSWTFPIRQSPGRAYPVP